MRSPEFRMGPSPWLQGSGPEDRPTSWLELGQSPPGRGLARRPPPATLGLLDPQPGCCAEIPEHKRPRSGQGRGRGRGQPSSMLTGTIGAFRAGRPSYHQRLCGTKRAFSALEPDDGRGGCLRGPWDSGVLGSRPSPATAGPATALPLSGPQFPRPICVTSSSSGDQRLG